MLFESLISHDVRLVVHTLLPSMVPIYLTVFEAALKSGLAAGGNPRRHCLNQHSLWTLQRLVNVQAVLMPFLYRQSKLAFPKGLSDLNVFTTVNPTHLDCLPCVRGGREEILKMKEWSNDDMNKSDAQTPASGGSHVCPTRVGTRFFFEPVQARKNVASPYH